jgi:hypothetical protein
MELPLPKRPAVEEAPPEERVTPAERVEPEPPVIKRAIEEEAETAPEPPEAVEAEAEALPRVTAEPAEVQREAEMELPLPKRPAVEEAPPAERVEPESPPVIKRAIEEEAETAPEPPAAVEAEAAPLPRVTAEPGEVQREAEKELPLPKRPAAEEAPPEERVTPAERVVRRKAEEPESPKREPTAPVDAAEAPSPEAELKPPLIRRRLEPETSSPIQPRVEEEASDRLPQLTTAPPSDLAMPLRRKEVSKSPAAKPEHPLRDVYDRLERRYPQVGKRTTSKIQTKAESPSKDVFERLERQYGYTIQPKPKGRSEDVFERLEARYGSPREPVQDSDLTRTTGISPGIIQRLPAIQIEPTGPAGPADIFRDLQARYGLQAEGAGEAGEFIQRSALPSGRPEEGMGEFGPSGIPGVAWQPQPETPRQQPLELVRRRAAVSSAGADLVQRQPETTSVEKKETTSIGPPEIEPAPESEEQKEEKPDLDDLARQVYPLIKRMLTIESERSRGRPYL